MPAVTVDDLLSLPRVTVQDAATTIERPVAQVTTAPSGFEGEEGALPIRSDARVLGATIKAGETVEYRFSEPNRYGYLVPAMGTVEIGGLTLGARDGAAIHDESVIQVTATEDTELVLVDTASID